MERFTVYPVEGRTVPDPELGGTLRPEGRAVPRDAYWLRRLRDGDVTEQKPAKGKKAVAETQATDRGSAEQ